MKRLNLYLYKVFFYRTLRGLDMQPKPTADMPESEMFNFLNLALQDIQQRIPISGTDDDEARTWDRTSEDLRRLWQPLTTVATAGFSFDGTAVTLSAAAPEDRLEVGDEIGFFPTLQSDLSTVESSANRIPLQWYEISAIDEARTGLTVPAIKDAANATAQFVTAQVPEIEDEFANKLGAMVPELAVAMYVAPDDPQRAAILSAKVSTALANFSRDQDDTTVPRIRPTLRTPYPPSNRL